MTDTSRLGLPLLAAAQAQKHVTHNEALLALDALLHLACLDRDLASPPVGPAEGARYLVAPNGAGAWAGQSSAVAEWRDGIWHFTPARPGFVAYLVDEGGFVIFDGSAWTALGTALGVVQNLSRLGIGTAADAASPFTARLNSALWTARSTGEGGTGNLRVVLNKQSASGVASLVMQSGYSGRAELGLTGSDDLSIKTSPDGAAWTEALRVTSAGRVAIGGGTAPERLTVAGNIAPALDNAYSLGTASLRVSAVWSATGTISTSDLRLKAEVEPLDGAVALRLLRATPPIAFRWTVGGRDAPDAPRAGRRRHFGWAAQAWKTALDREGLEAGLLVMVDPADPASELGLRPDQIAAVQHAGLLALTARVEALEGASRSREVSGPSTLAATDRLFP